MTKNVLTKKWPYVRTVGINDLGCSEQPNWGVHFSYCQTNLGILSKDLVQDVECKRFFQNNLGILTKDLVQDVECEMEDQAVACMKGKMLKNADLFVCFFVVAVCCYFLWYEVEPICQRAQVMQRRKNIWGYLGSSSRMAMLRLGWRCFV